MPNFNWTGECTQPGPRLYPHQWSWDSALIAIGYSHYDQDRAMRELSHLFDSQWNNGLLPQIVFNPRFGEYFPGIDFWHAERSPDAPPDRKSSGVVQPPVHATAVLYVYQHAKDATAAKEFLERTFPKIIESGSSCAPIRSRNTDVRTYTSWRPGTGPWMPPMTALSTWSSSSPIATTTKPGLERSAPSWCRTCSSTRLCARRTETWHRSRVVGEDWSLWE